MDIIPLQTSETITLYSVVVIPPPDIGRAHRVPPVAGVNRGL